MLNCSTLRGAILTSGVLLIAAFVVEILAQTPLFPSVVTGYLGLLLLFAAVGVLGAAFVIGLLPGANHRFGGCEH